VVVPDEILSVRLAEASRAATRPTRMATHEITLERRSAYLMAGESRNAYEHRIPAVTTLRYSITFRTLRDAVSESG